MKKAYGPLIEGLERVVEKLSSAANSADAAASARNWDRFTSDAPNADGSKSFGQIQNERANQATLHAVQASTQAQLSVMQLSMRLPPMFAEIQAAVNSLYDFPQVQEALRGGIPSTPEMNSINLTPEDSGWAFIMGTDGFIMESQQVEALERGKSQLQSLASKFREVLEAIKRHEKLITLEHTQLLCTYRDYCIAIAHSNIGSQIGGGAQDQQVSQLEADLAKLRQLKAEFESGRTGTFYVGIVLAVAIAGATLAALISNREPNYYQNSYPSYERSYQPQDPYRSGGQGGRFLTP